MTAPKIDTQAPERIWVTGEYSLWPTFRSFNASDLDHSNDDGTSDYPEYILVSLSAAREAAAWQAGIDALLDRVGDLPISEIAADEVIYAAKQLTPPTDPAAALDRLIAERVREAYLAGHRTARAWHDDVLSAEDGFANFIAARGSKDGRDG